MKTNWKTRLNQLLQPARRRPGMAALVCAVVIGLVVFFQLRHGDGDLTQFTYHQVKRGDFLVSIVEGGTLKAVNELTVRSEMEGVARIISIVPEGTNVHQGDLLVELDSSELRERMTAQEVTYQNAQFAFIQAKENLLIQKSVIESNIKEAELRVEFARSDLEKYKEGDWPQLRKVTEAKITIAAEELERTRNKNDWTKKLYEKGYATKSELEADALSVKRKEIELAQSQEELRLLTKYDYPKKVRLLEANVESYSKELDRVKHRAESTIAQLEASLKSQQNTLDLQDKRLRELKAQLERTRILAPQDGLVVYASSTSQGSGTLIEEGATIRQKQDIIKLPDVSKMMLEVRVHESHVQKIKPGLNALVTIDSLPDQQFRASVHKVAVLPESSSRFFNPNLKVYVTEVHIHDPLPDLKPGISGRAELVITNLQQVLTVPIQAVTTIRGQQVCMVEDGSRARPVPVEVGMYNDRLIEIKSGIKEGDMVALSVLEGSDNIDISGAIVGSNGLGTNVGFAPQSSPETLAAPVADPDRKERKGGAGREGRKRGEGGQTPTNRPPRSTESVPSRSPGDNKVVAGVGTAADPRSARP